MGNVQVINGNVVVDTRTGVQQIFGKETDPDKYYAVAVKCGHCGNGYYIPVVLAITAKSEEMALAIARKVGRVKKLNHDGIIAIEEINLAKYYIVEYINDCDPYFSSPQHASIDDIESRRVIMEGLVVKDRSKLHKSLVLPESVKTADEYDQLHVLQRYLAPRFYGSQLVFPPKRKGFASVLEEYIYENTIELGFNRNKLSILSFYYQVYGPNNPLNIDYNNGVITIVDADNRLFEYYVPKTMKEHLDIAKAEFDKLQQEQKQEEQVQVKKVTIPTARQKFAERYSKYQNMTSTNVK